MVNGKKTAESIKKKYGDDYYSVISKRRKTFSGGAGFRDVERAKKAQETSVKARMRNKQLRGADNV